MKNRILLVDDDLLSLQASSGLLEMWGYDVDVAASGQDALKLLPTGYAVVLADYQMPGMNGAELIAEIQKRGSSAVCLIYSCDDSREAMRSSLKAGAIDFVDKDENTDALRERLAEAMAKFEATAALYAPLMDTSSESKDEDLEFLRSIGMIGRSEALREIGRKCRIYRDRTSPVLIFGETGAGKELVAHGIHGDGPGFFPVNCASYAESHLIESELFGYEKGAFTGAITRKAGIFETAGRGTVFLDEVEKLGPKAQGALFRAVREKKIRRLGAAHETDIHCRIIAAAKPDLRKRVDRGEFSSDLYFRLNFLYIEVPALREHREDIPFLVEHFRKKICEDLGVERKFHPKILEVFQGYAWPGNVGELQGCLEKLLTDARGELVAVSQLDSRFAAAEDANPALTLPELDVRYERERKRLIDEAIRSTSSRRSAAVRLGVNESTLRSIVTKAESVKRAFRGMSGA